MCQYLQSIVYTRFRPIIHTTTQATQQATTGQIVHVITPTYTRDTQLCDLTRLSQALAVAAGAGTRVQWIIVEDRATKSNLVKRFVYDTQVMAKSHFGGAGIPLTLVHLAVAEKRVRGRFKAGTQRNAAIEYILTHKEVPAALLLPLKTHSSSSAIVDTASESSAPKRATDNNIKSKPKLQKPSVAGVNHDVSSITATTSSDTATRSDDGVVLFIDDDNAIDHRLLSAASGITSVGVWAVGYSGARRVEYPIVNATSGRVTNFHSWSPAFRASYPVDMAAFGVAVSLLERNKAARFEPLAPASTGEVRFLTAVGVPWSRLETLPDALKSKVLVWHVHTRARVDAAHTNDGRGLFRYV